MSASSDQTSSGSMDTGAEPRAGRPAPRAPWWRSRATLALLLVVLALAALLVVRSRTTLDLGQRCGSIVRGAPAVPTSAAVVHTEITCFAQAYAHCTAASLESTFNFGDGSDQQTFVVVPGQGSHGTCGLVLQWSTYIAGAGHTTAGQERCAGLTRQGDVLTFHDCGTAGDVRVPPGP